MKLIRFLLVRFGLSLGVLTSGSQGMKEWKRTWNLLSSTG